jgi:hypothetical protein
MNQLQSLEYSIYVYLSTVYEKTKIKAFLIRMKLIEIKH